MTFVDALLTIPDWAGFMDKLSQAAPDHVEDGEVTGWDRSPAIVGGSGGRIVYVRMSPTEAATWRALAPALGVTIVREQAHDGTNGKSAGLALYTALTASEEAELAAIYTRQSISPPEGGVRITPSWRQVVGVIG